MTPDYITKFLTPMSQTHSLNKRSGETGALYVPFSCMVHFHAQLQNYGTNCFRQFEIPSL